jgi:hypothetical protein
MKGSMWANGDPPQEEPVSMTEAAMRDMAAALAKLSDAERKTVMGERLRMFAEMSDAERKRAMGAMMDGVAALPDEDNKQKLFQTRFEIRAELTEAQRSSLMARQVSIVMEEDEQMMQKK